MAEHEPVQVKFDVRKVYVKDLSFESPQAPDVFVQSEQTPSIDVQLSISHKKLSDQTAFHEVVLSVTVTAKAKDQTIFLAEVQQAGVFQIEGVGGTELPLALEIACPNMLLPFAREAISDLVGKGGFPQLLISPVNFEALYQRKRQQQDSKQTAGDEQVTIN